METVINMDVNQIQKQIAELIEKLKEIGIDSYYDNKYTFKIRNDEYDSVVTLNNSNEMIYISIVEVEGMVKIV